MQRVKRIGKGEKGSLVLYANAITRTKHDFTPHLLLEKHKRLRKLFSPGDTRSWGRSEA